MYCSGKRRISFGALVLLFHFCEFIFCETSTSLWSNTGEMDELSSPDPNAESTLMPVWTTDATDFNSDSTRTLEGVTNQSPTMEGSTDGSVPGDTASSATVAGPPGTGQSETGAPATDESGSSAPVTGETGTEALATHAPSTGDLSTEKPGTNPPETDNPETGGPGTTGPGTDEPGTGTPGTSGPGTTGPRTDEPGTGTSGPGTGAPGTDGSSTQTLAQTTVTVQTPVTLPPNVFEPDVDDKFFNISMQLALFRGFSDGLVDSSSDEYKTLASALIANLSQSFTEGFQYPAGFRNIEIRRFMSRTGAESRTLVPLVIQSDNDTVVEYSINYDFTSLNTINDVTILVEYINGTFTDNLYQRRFDGSAVDSSYTDTYNRDVLVTTISEQLQSDVGDPCSVVRLELCDVCQVCEQAGDGELRKFYCDRQCVGANRICATDGSTNPTPECVCDSDHLDMANSCVDKRIIIGVFSGVGGALVLGLIIGVAVLSASRRKDGKEKDYRGEELISGYQPDPKSGWGYDNQAYKSTGLYDVKGTPNADYDTGNGGHSYSSGSYSGLVPASGPDPTVSEIQDTDAYQCFSASVRHIDPEKNYFAERPKIKIRDSMRSSTYKEINTESKRL